MKRYFFAPFVVLLALAAATLAFAQTKGILKMDFEKPIARADAVRVLAQGAGLSYRFEVEPAGEYKGKIEGTMPEILAAVLGPEYSFGIEDFTLYVRPSPTPAPAPAAAPAPPAQLAGEFAIQRHNARVGPLYDPATTQPVAVVPPVLAGEFAIQRHNAMAWSPYGYSPGAYGAGYPGYSMSPYGGYGWAPGPYLISFFQNEINRQTYGLIKIDGPDRDLQSVRVVVNDRDKGVASKYNNRFNGAVMVRVKDLPGNQTKTQKLQFIRESKGKIERVTRWVEVEPFAVTGYKNILRLRVDSDTFRDAEFLDRLEQQPLPDEEEGSYSKKLPAPPKK